MIALTLTLLAACVGLGPDPTLSQLELANDVLLVACASVPVEAGLWALLFLHFV